MLDRKCKACYTIITTEVKFTLQKEVGYVKNRIQELRKSRKVTQQELADALSVTRQTIISLENGKYNASLVLAHKTAQYFVLPIEELFIFDGEDENIDVLADMIKSR